MYERPLLKYMQPHVCRNSYTGTRTVPDSYSCLYERSLIVLSCLYPNRFIQAYNILHFTVCQCYL